MQQHGAVPVIAMVMVALVMTLTLRPVVVSGVIRPFIVSGVQNAPFPTYISLSRWSWTVATGALDLDEKLLAAGFPFASGALAVTMRAGDMLAYHSMRFGYLMGTCYAARDCGPINHMYYSGAGSSGGGYSRTFLSVTSGYTCPQLDLTTLTFNDTASNYVAIHTCDGANSTNLFLTTYSSSSGMIAAPISTKLLKIPPPLDGRWESWAVDALGAFVLDPLSGFWFVDPVAAVARPLTFSGISVVSPPLLFDVTRPGLFVVVGRDRSGHGNLRLVQSIFHGLTVQEVTQRSSVDLPFVDVQNIIATLVPGTDGPVVYGFSFNGTQYQDEPRRFVFAVDLSVDGAPPKLTWREQNTKGTRDLWQAVSRYSGS